MKWVFRKLKLILFYNEHDILLLARNEDQLRGRYINLCNIGFDYTVKIYLICYCITLNAYNASFAPAKVEMKTTF